MPIAGIGVRDSRGGHEDPPHDVDDSDKLMRPCYMLERGDGVFWGVQDERSREAAFHLGIGNNFIA